MSKVKLCGVENFAYKIRFFFYTLLWPFSGIKQAQVSHLLPHQKSFLFSCKQIFLAFPFFPFFQYQPILSPFSFFLTEATPLPYLQLIFILITLLPLTTTVTISLSASLAGNQQRRPCPLDCQPATTHFGTITSSLDFRTQHLLLYLLKLPHLPI